MGLYKYLLNMNSTNSTKPSGNYMYHLTINNSEFCIYDFRKIPV